jgi:anti-sigma factor RsiW
MMADDALLLAYVDGALSLDERLAVKAQLRDSVEARKKVALIRASQVDFADAFAHQPLPPVPDALRLCVDEMVRAHRSARDSSSASDMATSVSSALVKSRWRSVPVWLAAACVAGAFVLAQFVRIGSPFGHPALGPVSSQTANGVDVSPWVQVAVVNQQLYTRDTVAYRQDDPALAARVVEDIRRDDRLALRVPDLSGSGLTFKSVRRLRFNNKPLAQILYLPRSGAPIALCVVNDTQPDKSVTLRTIDGMDVATWRQSGLSYALIAQSGAADLAELGGHISDLDTVLLFGGTPKAAPRPAPGDDRILPSP